MKIIHHSQIYREGLTSREKRPNAMSTRKLLYYRHLKITPGLYSVKHSSNEISKFSRYLFCSVRLHTSRCKENPCFFIFVISPSSKKKKTRTPKDVVRDRRPRSHARYTSRSSSCSASLIKKAPRRHASFPHALCWYAHIKRTTAYTSEPFPDHLLTSAAPHDCRLTVP